MGTAVREVTPGRVLHAGRRGARPGTRKDAVTRGLGGFSAGLGVAQVAAPKLVERLVGVRDTSLRRTIMRAVGVRELVAAGGIFSSPRPGGWLTARVAGDALDIALLAAALGASDSRRRRVAGALGAVAGITVVDFLAAKRMSRGGAPAPGDEDVRVAQSITVSKSPDDVYAFWRELENLPRFMTHLELVRETGEGRSHWRAKAPLGRTVEWDAETVEDRPGELIAWRSLPGGQVEHHGVVRFAPAPGARGTEVRVELRYSPPAGAFGAGVAKLLGEEPQAQVYDDLKRFKQVLETGEIVRSEGTPEGIGLVQQLMQRAAQPPKADDEAVAAARGERS